MKVLLQDNIGSHYRKAIYSLIGEAFDCGFCFGDKWGDIKTLDYSKLKGPVIEAHNIILPHCYYQQGMLRTLFLEYDVYILNGETRCISTWVFLLLHKLFFRKKLVYFWAHGMLGKEGIVKQFIIKQFYSLVDGAFIYNERSCRIMSERGIPASKLHPIYNSLDYDKQLLIRKELYPTMLYQDYFKNSNKNIVFIGRLTKIKRLDILLNAIYILNNRGNAINVTFIGDGEDRNYLEQLVNTLGINELVWFYGASYDEMNNARLIYNADLCVSPGNIGLTAMHVMMFGCPAITNNDFDHQMPEFEAIQEGVTGDFFTAGDSSSLADSITRWFKQHNDDREIVRHSCYRVIDEKWNPHIQIKIIENVLGL